MGVLCQVSMVPNGNNNVAWCFYIYMRKGR